jgi:hypothetical protein
MFGGDSMPEKYRDFRRREKSINLVPGISEQDFLTVICWTYEGAARFVLNWADGDVKTATSFISGFLWRVLSELNIDSPAMDRKNRGQPGLRTPGTSVCSVAFQRFCELLYENPDLVRRIRETPPYSGLQRSEDLLSQRDSNWFSLSRGLWWHASGLFEDPEPIPQNIRDAFLRAFQVEEEEYRARILKEAEAREVARQAKRAERLRQAALKQEANKQESEQRKVLRDNFLSKSVYDQLVTLASDTHTPLTVFPFNPRSVTDDMLNKLGDSLLGCLEERVAKRWEAWWKELAQRIYAIRNR